MSDAGNPCCTDSALCSLCSEQGLGTIGGGDGNCRTLGAGGAWGVAGVGVMGGGGWGGIPLGGGGGGGGPGPESIYVYMLISLLCAYIHTNTYVSLCWVLWLQC